MTSNIRCEAQRKSLVYTTATVQFCITDEVYDASTMEYIKHNRDLQEKGNNMEAEPAAGAGAKKYCRS